MSLTEIKKQVKKANREIDNIFYHRHIPIVNKYTIVNELLDEPTFSDEEVKEALLELTTNILQKTCINIKKQKDMYKNIMKKIRSNF